MIKIAVPGITGRMGSAIAEQILQDKDLLLIKITGRALDPDVSKHFMTSDLHDKFDVLIDFTSAEGVMNHLQYCLDHNIAMVIGVTGLDEVQLNKIHQAAKKIPIVFSANMSIGVNITNKLLETAAKAFDASWQVNISDLHHQHKKDSPSGTAKHMAQIIANARGVDPTSIVIKSERYGEVPGSHTITFSNASESVTIMHIANNRTIFAVGAVDAAKWLVVHQVPGLYSMADVIGCSLQ